MPKYSRKTSLFGNPNQSQEQDEAITSTTASQGTFPTGESHPDQTGRNVPFSIDRTFSASSEFFDDDDDEDREPTVIRKPNQYKSTEERRREFFQQFTEEISDTLPSDLPSGVVDIEGNLIETGAGVCQEDDEDDDDEYFQNHHQNNNHKIESHRKSSNSQMNSHNHHPNHNFPGTSSNAEIDPNDDINNDINNDGDSGVSSGGGGGKNGVNRKKSILRQNQDKNGGGSERVNSFNENAGGSSMISDGKLGGSMNGSFNSQFYNNFYSRAARRNDFQRYTRGPYAPLDRCNSNSASSANSSTIFAHYYPENGWGYVVLATAMFSHALLCGFLLSGGVFATKILERFGHELRTESVWLTSLSLGVSLLLSPLWVSICKRKSTRLTAVFGGLVVSLGCLFTSFASQFHQLYFSYVIFIGIGVGLTRDASMLMVGQYFKRKRDYVETLLVSASGLGILVMSLFMEYALSSIGWRLGLQAITGTLVLTFFLGSCYRSASLYHPQRRAIIHLKNQKRKIKEKEKKNDRPPFLDVSCLGSRSTQIFLISCAATAWGLYSPLFHLALECQDEGMDETDKLLLYVYIGAGWVIGAWTWGFLAIQRNDECRIGKLYLTQVAALLCGISIIALTSVKEPSGLVTFSWVYGIGMGGYHYTLKIQAYEKFRARVFPRAWSFVQSVQGAALLFGIPVAGYINTFAGWRKGYFLSAGAIFLGFFIMALSTVGGRQLTRHKSSRSSMKTCETGDSIQSPGLRRISFTFPDEQMSPPRISKEERSSSGSERSRISRNGSHIHSHGGEQQMIAKELTRISEEGILDTNH